MLFLFLEFFSIASDCCPYCTGYSFGPSVINIFINDVCSVFHCFVYISFVGDISIFRAIKSPSDSNLLQSHIDSRWSCSTATWTIVDITEATVNSSSRKTDIRMFAYERYESHTNTKTWGECSLIRKFTCVHHFHELYVVIVFTTFVSNFSHCKKNWRISSKICIDFHVKCPLFLSDIKETWIFLTNFRKILISNFMKICPMETEMLHADGRTETHRRWFLQFGERI